MRLRQFPRALITTLFIGMMCLFCLGLAVTDNVAANPDDALTTQETASDEFDSPDEDGNRDDEFTEDDSLNEEDELDMEGFDDEEEIEFHQMEIESNIARLEMINRLAEIAKDDVAMASYAIMHLEDSMESEEAGIQILKEMIASDQVSHPVRNLLKMKLAELYSWSDQESAAIDTFKSMLMSK